jgi:hypothetical protein
MRHREYLGRYDYGVVLMRTPEDETLALQLIDEARERCVCAEFLVEDLRP